MEEKNLKKIIENQTLLFKLLDEITTQIETLSNNQLEIVKFLKKVSKR